MKKQLLNTKSKLDEAGYFLLKLHDVDSNSKEFEYYLSAFVSSARSITWVMKAEFGNSEYWNKWYEQQKPSKEEEELLKYFNQLRIETNKIKPLKTSHHIEFNIPPEQVTDELIRKLENLKNKKGEMIFAENEDDIKGYEGIIIGKAKLENVLLKVNNVESNFEIIDACEKYFESLKWLVNECELKFCI